MVVAFCSAFCLGALKGFLQPNSFSICGIDKITFYLFQLSKHLFSGVSSLCNFNLSPFQIFLFLCICLCLRCVAGLLVGPIAGLIVVIGNVGVILGLFPAHVAWTVYSLIK